MANRIAILGWGSLVWDSRGLPIENGWMGSRAWYAAGPVLALEFSRISDDGRLTLVIDHDNGTELLSLYAFSSRTNLIDAKSDLQFREGTTENNIKSWSSSSPTQIADGSEAKPMGTVAAWAAAKGIDHVVWTGLSTNFEKKSGKPFTAESAIAHLDQLSGVQQRNACRYVRRAPEQIQTAITPSARKLLP